LGTQNMILAIYFVAQLSNNVKHLHNHQKIEI